MRCDFPRCREPAAYGYITANICQRHWHRLCEATELGDGTENRLLAKLGLIRDETGAVVRLLARHRRQRKRDVAAAQPAESQRPIETPSLTSGITDRLPSEDNQVSIERNC